MITITDDRADDICATLNSFVAHAPDGVDFNLDKAVDWAREQDDVAGIRRSGDGHTPDVHLADGTVLFFVHEEARWCVEAQDDLS